ncbi:type ISP restriction/modification enzyme [Rhodococcus sp. NPDC058481]|uniref:type ISP restriction/modification enzyme n=1 Tax=unclassified Rhodococcus (in: high G+C Gram-positive bacteria) TaxID=192944 RepID=UPI00364FA2AB
MMAVDSTVLADLVAKFGSDTKTKLSGPGEREAQLSGPVAQFITDFGNAAGMRITTHDEVSLDGVVRPDFGVIVDGVLTGFIELKAPDVSLDPSTYGKSTHNYRQWQRLKELPNLLHTNGIEWRLWRYGELVDQPIRLHTPSLVNTRGRLTAPGSLELILSGFLRWKPVPITSVAKLVDTLAPLARMLREEVKLAMTAERRAVKAGADKEVQPFLGLAKDWRAMLFPHAKDEEFADGFAQTVVFALMLAVSDGIDVGSSTLNEVSKKLENHHTLMGMALNLLTEHINKTPAGTAIEMIARTLSAVQWDKVAGGKEDVYLHLYEHFLSVYDPEKRKKTGSYYTPVEVVDFMTRLTDDVLKQHFGKRDGFRNPHVTVVDSSMGTGTYPLGVLRHVGAAAEAEYGKGARPEAVSNMASRLYGIELQSGPFSVAELRLSEAMKTAGASLPEGGMNMYVADTLEDPDSGSDSQLSYTMRLIAQQRLKANKMKRELNVQVSIGNPPYLRDTPVELGGWIANGMDANTHKTPIDAFRHPGNGLHEWHLNNLYVWFWRWSTWKVFESTDRPSVRDGGNGVVCYITAAGYLTGPGFRGMRDYLRRKASHGWIINVSPEGKRPPAKNTIFNIETPVVIALFARTAGTLEDVPAEIRYISIHGTREEKYKQLNELAFTDERWRLARTDWTAPFTPAAAGVWDEHPALSDLIPWVSPGVMPNRTWVYGPNRSIIEERLRAVVYEDDAEKKSALFKESRDANLDKIKKPLPGMDTESETQNKFRDVVMIPDPKIVRVGYRSFDRQYLIADSRLLHQQSVSLWHGRIRGQVYCFEPHSIHPGKGPGVSFSALVPDMNFFKGSEGGRVLPMLHPDGTANLAPGLLHELREKLGIDVNGEDVTYYVAGVVSHPAYTEQFDDELNTPGIRVPITMDPELWAEAVELGRQVVWLHTYGAGGAHPEGCKDVRESLASNIRPSYDESVGKVMPETIRYDEDAQTLHIGKGQWGNVSPAVRGYTVGGRNVIDSWFGYRHAAKPGHSVTGEKAPSKRKSALDAINVTIWPSEWSNELSELLSVLTQLVALEPSQQDLLDRILMEEMITRDQLADAGVVWPTANKDRNPHLPPMGEREARAFFADVKHPAAEPTKYRADPNSDGWVMTELVTHSKKPARWIVDHTGRIGQLTGDQSPDPNFEAL